nr:hypothetical protein [Candidatus Sigynarchaeum springense]
MPRICKIFFSSIGHPDARLDPLTLDFETGEHTILQLDNSGGKSSILGLFYSVIRPRKTEFMGKEENRSIDDYIKEDDLACVAMKWIMDEQSSEEYLVTGSVYEWHSGNLERFYFSFYHKGNPAPDQLTIQSLPLMKDGKRLTIAGFKEEMKGYKERNPEQKVFLTNGIQEWMQHLDECHIDTQTFYYQLIMNKQEGQADDFFSFKSNKEFIDFFIDLVHNPEAVQGSFELLKKLMGKIVSLAVQKKEIEFIEQLIPRLEALAKIVKRKEQAHEDIAKCNASLTFSLRAIQGEEETEEGIYKELTAQSATQERILSETSKALLNARWKHQAMLEKKLGREKDALTNEKARIKNEQGELEQEAHVLEVLPLKLEIQEINSSIKVFQDQLNESIKPIEEELADRGTKIHSLVLGSLEEKEKRRAKIDKDILSENKRKEAIERQTATAQATIRLNDSIIATKTKIIKTAQKEREKLVAEGLLKPDQDPRDAIKLLGEEQERLEQEKVGKEAEIKLIEQKETDELKKKSNAIVKKGEEEAKRSIIEADLKACNKKWRELASNRAFQTYVSFSTQVPDIDHTILRQDAKDRISKAKNELNVKIKEISYASQQRKIKIDYYDKTKEAAPDEDVAKIKKNLVEGGLNAHIGWDYAKTSLSATELSTVMALRPHLLDGIVVSGMSLDEVMVAVTKIIDNRPVTLSRPVIVTTTQSIKDQDARGFFTIHRGIEWKYDPDKLRDFILSLRSESVEIEKILKLLDSEHEDARACLELWEKFLADYPSEIFQGWLAQVQSLTGEITRIEAEIAASTKALETYAANRRTAEEYLRKIKVSSDKIKGSLHKLTTYMLNHGTLVETSNKDIQAAREEISKNQEIIDSLEPQIKEIADMLALWQDSMANLVREIQDLELKKRSIKYFNPEKVSKQRILVTGELDRLEREYGIFEEQYKGLTKESDIARELDKQRNLLAKRQPDYEKMLSQFGLEDPEILEYQSKHGGLEKTGISLKKQKVYEQVSELTAQIKDKENDIKAVGKDIKAAEKEREKIEAEGGKIDGFEIPPHHEIKAAIDNAILEEKDLDEKKESTAHMIDGLKPRIEQSKATIGRWEKYKTMVESRLEDQGIFVPTQAMIDAAVFPFTINEIESYINNFVEKRIDLRSKYEEAEKGAEAEVSSIDVFASEDRFADIENFPANFKNFQYVDSNDVNSKVTELGNRARVIEQDIANLEKYLTNIITTVKSDVTNTLNELYTLSRVTINEQRLGPLAGKRVLKIKMPEIADDELCVLIRSYLLQYARDAQMQQIVINGVTLLKEIINHITSGKDFDIKFVKPPKDEFIEYKSIPEFHKFSRCEKITIAIIFYCIMVQYRLQKHALSVPGKNTSVLVLDNPIGQCSKPEYVAMQVDIASSMGIQLIYASGVAMQNSIVSFPNTIPLKNQRRDTRGNMYIEIDANRIPHVEGGHVLRKKPLPPLPDAKDTQPQGDSNDGRP